ncbi:S8 family serine peptidase [Algoriphagus aestuarii]|nr:S8 family serine peptidase [Algoriphagus aestuarii]
MKNLALFLILCFFLISCKNDKITTSGGSQISENENTLNPLGVSSKQLIEGSYLFYLDENEFVPIVNGPKEDMAGQISPEIIGDKKLKIKDYFKQAHDISINDENIFVISFSGFLMENISEKDAERIKKHQFVIAAQQNFTFQNIRPSMQSNPIPENIRPSMQENQTWQYDSQNKTSTNVSFVNPLTIVGSEEHKIWIIDTGIDGTHKDLNVIGTVMEGGVNVEYSKSFVPSEPNPLEDFLGHGTHCAGIASGKAHAPNDPNQLGMNGVSPGAPVVSIKVINKNGFGIWAKVVKALEHVYSLANSGDIINMSIGAEWQGPSTINYCSNPHGNLNKVLEQIGDLATIKNVYVVIAAGNEKIKSENYFPGCYVPTLTNDSTITVASIKTTFDFEQGIYLTPVYSDYSSYKSPTIDFVSPGEEMFSTYPGNSYRVMSGTSMSTALMSGIIHARNSLPNSTSVEKVHGLTSNGDSGSEYPIGKVN